MESSGYAIGANILRDLGEADVEKFIGRDSWYRYYRVSRAADYRNLRRLDEDGKIIKKKGKPVADPDQRDTENVPFTYEGGIDAFMKNEVLTYAPDAFVDEKKTIEGYEISFTKYFYNPVELREMSDILESLSALEKDADGVLTEIMGGQM